jgi:hypothetical protein
MLVFLDSPGSRVRLTRRGSVNHIVLPAMLGNVLQSIGLDKTKRVTGLWPVVDPGDIEAG